MEHLWSPWLSHQRKQFNKWVHFWVTSMLKLPVSNQNRPWHQSKVPLHQAERNWSCTRILLQMDLFFSVVLSSWMIIRPKRKLLLILSHSDQLKLSCINVKTNSIQLVFNIFLKMMKDSDSLLLMVVVHCLLPFKEMLEIFFKRLLLSYQRSTEEVVNRQTDLQD